ncbi:oligogalacturonate-specific porin KdgM family protein, partial [Salmonella enterica]|uniref:oligogalacturonate-specific porin KdgM family protein n=1 Tax=Salmonella enterica TaxID=28901 RepID=UPI003298AF5A
GTYKKADKSDLYAGGTDNYEYNFRTADIIDQGSPFVEVGNVSVNSTSDERQNRIRVGIGYTY